MKLRTCLCIMLSIFFLGNISFAKSTKKQSPDNADNPYGFKLVDEAVKMTTTIEADENADVDMEEVNENDTYQAQSNADTAAMMKKLDREAVQLSKKVKPGAAKQDSEKSMKTRQPANKAEAAFHKFISNPKVEKILSMIRSGWAKFKKWFLKLPGIRHWVASPYSMENYKKELGNVDYVENKNTNAKSKKR